MNEKQKSLKKLLRHLSLCCGIPLVILILVPLFYRINPSLGTMMAGVAPLICPIMMISMIFMMGKGKSNQSCCKDKS